MKTKRTNRRLQCFNLAWFAMGMLIMTGNMQGMEYDVRRFGATGDGVALDSPAINAAIAAAAEAGGGTVRLPAGTYLSLSIHLKSDITLYLDSGARLLAATPSEEIGQYDLPEPNVWGDEHKYQDFGHSHWHNSLLWGEDLDNVTIAGPGLRDGAGLLSHPSFRRGPNPIGQGNKSIALKNCRNVTLRDFSMLRGGHFALLATGVDNLVVHNLRIDTNRDGLDIDACRNVRISDCSINSLNDDAIVLKASYALGKKRNCEDITITNCLVSGFDPGSMLDGTYLSTIDKAVDRDGPTGRIKIGTESNGDFRNITISNCVFRRSRGLALESVDGGVIEDVVISNITMVDVSNAPIFIHLGNRARGPEGTPPGAIRRVRISGVSASQADGRFPIILTGLPGHPIEAVTLEGIQVASKGGVSMEDVATQPGNLVNDFFLRGDEPGVTGPRDPYAVPLREAAYPEPSMFGLLPASVLYARHVKDLTVRDLTYSLQTIDDRPLVVLKQADRVTLETVTATPSNSRNVVLRSVRQFKAYRFMGMPDRWIEVADEVCF
ncbi:MAG TPA: glycosyl hydrolase family 28 protein [Oceanipulchritudo sp.]|nr:glycosyl hydrolase family 28 protein [Oceanipulchritudo sp.]